MAQHVRDREGSAAGGFLARPTVAKTVLVVVAYLAFYLLVGWLTGLLAGDEIDRDDVLATAPSVFFALVLPVGIGAAALLAFVSALGWRREIFGRQPVPAGAAPARSWMWIAPVLVLLAVAGHATAIDPGAWDAGQVAVILLAGVCIGFAEELATRGVAVKMLRDSGRSERFVMVVSSLLFALMHSVNALSGMPLTTVLSTLVYTFGFGVCMYLAMRVTGTLWTPIVLHALTDPTTFLATGGLDEHATGHTAGAGSAVLTLTGTVLMLVFALVAIPLVGRGARPAGQSPD
ncbi:CPBP family intramembrane glutamic endopeptidase [Streptomyces sp. NPDC085529]|uniref:CPBP family intramembrane glutamic endopeptidase n=1 Tax=Streptomyces sp. NPDC085529 TaxID=3365729 RepID=UPI0037D4B72A